jgi:hypothetical protein
MGVTIHYEGKLSDRESLQQCLRIASDFAASHQWTSELIEREEARLPRFFNEERFEYFGPTRGINVYPHENCEPVTLEFDRNLFLQDFTKTQFAGAEIHIRVIELLRAIEPCFASLEIFDEGEYWESSDRAQLETHLKANAEALTRRIAGHPSAKVMVKTADGKIVDATIDHAKEKARRAPWWQFWRRAG